MLLEVLTNSRNSSRIFRKFSMRSSLLISLIGISSLKGILSNLLGMDFFELLAPFATHYVSPQYSVIYGNAVFPPSPLATLHFISEPWLASRMAEYSLIDLEERSILRCSVSACGFLSLLNVLLCLDLLSYSRWKEEYCFFRFWYGCGFERAALNCPSSYLRGSKVDYQFTSNYSFQ